MSRQEGDIVEAIEERFSEVFLATTYASREDRKNALYRCMEPRKNYTIEELRRIFTGRYSFPISRVSINTYINELEAEGKVDFTRTGIGGKKRINLKSNET